MPHNQNKVIPPYAQNNKPLNTEAPEQTLESGVYTYFFIVWKRKKTFIFSLLFTLGIAVFINLTQKPIYQTSTEVVFQAKQSGGMSSGNDAAVSIVRDPTFLLTQLRLLRGPLLAERVIKKIAHIDNKQEILDSFLIRPVGEPAADSVFSEREQASLLGAIRGSVSGEQVAQGARILSIAMTGYNPFAVKQLVDAAAEAFIELNYELQIDSFKKNFSLISKSLGEIRDRIKTSELALQKVTKEIELLAALKIYGEKHPAVVILKTLIPTLAEKLKNEIKNLESMDVGQRKDRFLLLTETHLDLPTLLAIESDLQLLKSLLEQEVRSNGEMYNSLFKKLQEIEVSDSKNIWLDAKVIEPASLPGTPVRPNKRLNLLIAFLVGIFLGIGCTYLLEYLDSSMRTLDDVRMYLKIFPLGMVPEVAFDIEEQKLAQFKLEESSASRPYWNTNDANLPLYIAEAYRIIRTNLAFGSVDQAIKIIQVTSAVTGEGKTTTVCNLGISLAQAGLKTLLVDADMRRPSLHHILGLGDNEEGLSNALTDGESWKNYVRPTKVENLHCITGGIIPPNPSELLSSKRMRALLSELKEDFDMIILDSPPVISVADAPIIASFVEGSILVSRAGYIPRNICMRAKNALESVNSRIIGGILNSVTSHHQSYYYGKFYGQEYGYGYGHEEERKSERKRAAKSAATLTFLDKIKVLNEPMHALLVSLFTKSNQFIKSGQPPKKKNPSKPSDGKS